jgi:pimeloyl-ACP methyl ester carboxylesterase
VSVPLRWAAVGGVISLLIVALAAVAFNQAPAIAAGGLLHPRRMAPYGARPRACVDREFTGEGVTLRGWFCSAAGARRGTVIYLHGVADNRFSAAGPVERLTSRGLDVVAYDSRAHGQSDGDTCTYGFFEKQDLGHVIDGLDPGPVVLMGNSLGAAVALQGAVGHQRVAGVVAAEPFSDLRTIATERAPRYLPASTIQRAFRVAEEQGRFDVASVSPLLAARSLRIPVLLIHGADDRDTTPDHSQRLLEALAGPKQLLLVPHAGHNQSMGGPGVWAAIDRWLDTVLPEGPAAAVTQ